MHSSRMFLYRLAKFARTKANHAFWDSRCFSNTTVTSTQRALEIVDIVFDSNQVQEEIEVADRYLKSNDMSSTVLWRWFTALRDNVSIFSDGYREMLDWTVEALQSANKVVDYGTGTGNVAARLKYANPLRQLVCLDISPESAKIAEEKTRRFATNGVSNDFFVSDLTRPGGEDKKTEGIDGAVIINVNFTLPPDKRQAFLRRVYNDLKPGGMLVFNDPITVSADRERIREFARSVAQDAVRNGAPMTEFDLAWMAYYNLTKVAGVSGRNLSTPEELKKLVMSVGFEVLSERCSYYGMNYFLVLRKLEGSTYHLTGNKPVLRQLRRNVSRRNSMSHAESPFNIVPVQSNVDIEGVFEVARDLALEAQLESGQRRQFQDMEKALSVRGALVSAYTREYYEKAAKDPNVTMLLARDEKGSSVGFVFVYREGYIDRTDPKQHLNAFSVDALKAVHPDANVVIVKQIGVRYSHQNKGVGTLLYNEVINQLKADGVDYLCAAIVIDGKLHKTRFDDGRGIMLFNEVSKNFHEKRFKFKLMIEGYVYEDEILAYDSPDRKDYPSGIHVRSMYVVPLNPNLEVPMVEPPLKNRLQTYL